LHFPLYTNPDPFRLILIDRSAILRIKCRKHRRKIKDKENQKKHDVAFSLAQHAFLDPHRIIVEDVEHNSGENRIIASVVSEKGL
jgi:uncharacterized DUF497 family protein